MGLKTFINNIGYLFRYNIKSFGKFQQEEFPKQINAVIDNLVYELPSLNKRAQDLTRPKIKNYEETIDELIHTNKSICRYGDGELTLINKQSISFQEYNEKLASKLEEILISNSPDVMIGINHCLYYPDLVNVNGYGKYIARTIMEPVREKLTELINYDYQYYSADFTAPYISFKNYHFEEYYNKIKAIWEDKDIRIICGHKTFENIKYNIFDSAKSIEYQYAPCKNAFDKYDEIFDNAKENSQNKLIIIILGQTATVLAYNLAQHGIRALDIGHIAKDYNAYMNKTDINANSINKFFAHEE